MVELALSILSVSDILFNRVYPDVYCRWSHLAFFSRSLLKYWYQLLVTYDVHFCPFNL